MQLNINYTAKEIEQIIIEYIKSAYTIINTYTTQLSYIKTQTTITIVVYREVYNGAVTPFTLETFKIIIENDIVMLCGVINQYNILKVLSKINLSYSIFNKIMLFRVDIPNMEYDKPYPILKHIYVFKKYYKYYKTGLFGADKTHTSFFMYNDEKKILYHNYSHLEEVSYGYSIGYTHNIEHIIKEASNLIYSYMYKLYYETNNEIECSRLMEILKYKLINRNSQ